MKIWLGFYLFLFLFQPLRLPADEVEIEPLQEYDDDAFLSAKTPPESSDGLIGWSLFRSADDEDRYIINFNNVSILEYLRFVSKIADVNFQFEESELDFSTSIVSEEPLTVKNIVSALIQTLRARGFSVLEQDNNLLITQSREINQIPTIVSSKKEAEKKADAPIVTRIFRIQNANLNSLATILRPMMSLNAKVDISNETKQLIVTDVTTNVDKIAILLKSLDSPHSALEIEAYTAHNLDAKTLIALAEKIVKPFAEGNTLIFVPQEETNTVFIVSTEHLIERSVEVLEDLDVKPKRAGKGPIGDQVFLYKIKNKSGAELISALEDIVKELEGTGSQSIKLVAALENVKWIKESNSLLFITDLLTQVKIEEVLKTLDTIAKATNYYIFKVDKAGNEQIERSLEKLAKSLKQNNSEEDLVDAIKSMRYIKETNSFIFTGTEDSLAKLKELLPTFDVAVAEYSPSNHYWLYTPKYLSGKELEDAIEDLEDNLSSSGLTNEALLNAIESMKWVPTTNTLLFTGDPDSLKHIQAIIKLIDIPSGAPSKIYLYQPKYISNEQIEEALDELADKLDHKNLSDRNLAGAIDNMTWIRESRTFLFKSDPATIEKIEGFLKDIDNPKEAEAIGGAYFLFTLKYARGDEVIDHLEKIAKSLPDHDPEQKAIINVIDEMTFLKETNSILLTGSAKAVEEVKTLITQFDVKGATPPNFDKTEFFIYKPVHLSPTDLEEALKETATDLKKSGLIDASLLTSIDTMRVVELTNSLVFTGTKESLAKTKEIIASIDTKGAPISDVEEFAGHTFLIYKVRYIPVQELLNLIDKVILNMQKTETEENRAIIRSIKTAKEIKETNSIIFTGPAHVLEKIDHLVKQLDSPEGLGEGDMAREAGSYVIYKPVNVKGPELIDMMHEFAHNLTQSGVREKDLFQTIENLKYIARTNHILISGNQKSVEKVQELLKKFDAPSAGDGVTNLPELETSFLVYKLQYHPGKELKETLKKVGEDLAAANPKENRSLLTAINSIQWIKITNSLLATGNPEVLTKLKELIQNIDIPLRQVFIEVLIIETTLLNNQQFGLQWGGKVQYLNRFAGGIGNFPSPNPPSTGANQQLANPALTEVNGNRFPLATDIPVPLSTGGGFDLGVIGDIILHKSKTFISLGSLVNAIQQDNDSVIVMNPKIIAQDNQQSSIFVGQNIPFTGSQVKTVGGGASSQTQSNIEYRDVGVNLTITPIIGANDMVTLDISNEITAQVPTSTGGTAELVGLQTTRTSLNARVHVPNKHFVALSGMIQDEEAHFKSGIPCLGGLPIVGAFFSENDRANSRNNVIFFLRPVIIDSIEQYKQITDNQERLFKEQAVKQVVKEEIDDGIDMVKTPDDEW